MALPPNPPDDPATKWSLPKLLKELEEKYKKEGLHSRYWEPERPFQDGRLAALRETFEARYRSPSVLGLGGSGVVLKLTDNTLDRPVALKFPRPVEGQRDLIASLLDKEIESLASLRHGSIVRIHTRHRLFDRHGSGVSMFPCYIMDFVDGQSSAQFLGAADVAESAFLRIVDSTVDALAHLHARRIGHFDIKPDNVLVDASGVPVIADLGTAKLVGVSHGETALAVTSRFADPELIAYLDKDPSDDNRARGRLLRSGLRLEWDLVPLGKTLLDWLGYDTNGDAVARRVLLSPYVKKYFLLLAARLLRGNVPPWLEALVGLDRGVLAQLKYETVFEVLRDVRKVHGGHADSERVEELSEQFPQTIQVAAEAPTAFSPRTAKLVGHPFVRRLGAISQLGTVSLVYETATHTRREHSLGTFHNACRFVRHLLNDSYSPLFKQIMNADDIGTVLAAALLHDIGQFPLAHDLEEIDRTVFDHRHLGDVLLTEPAARSGLERQHWDALVSALADWGTTPEMVKAVLGAPLNDASVALKLKLLHSIVDGPIDSDKLDYLRRDSDRLRIPYGHGIDAERILRGLTTIVTARGLGAIACIGVHEKSKVAAEFVAMARYALFSQAYWHHAVRSSKAMLSRLVWSLLVATGDRPRMAEFTTRFYRFVRELPASAWPVLNEAATVTPDSTVAEQLAPTDAAMLMFIRGQAAALNCPEVVLVDSLLQRKLFKRLFVFSMERSRDDWKVFADAWDGMPAGARLHAYTHLEALLSRKASEYSARGGQTSRTDVGAADRLVAHVSSRKPLLLIDLPGPRPGSEVPLHYVVEAQRRALRKDARAIGDSNASEPWREYGSNLREKAGKVRIFCDPSHIDMVEVLITRVDFVRECKELFAKLDKGH